ncbi:MAG: twin-arginine translocase TatA/TatE family subunit [Desulfotomaculaceae bacterium]|nr:twin-arginine translocase TatA/TatE family subunit [Desulfotomaculaceae bacterium]
MPHIGAPELILVLALALIIFGPGKLPDLGKAVGKTIREFRRSSNEIMEDTETNKGGVEPEGQQAIKALKS